MLFSIPVYGGLEHHPRSGGVPTGVFCPINPGMSKKKSNFYDDVHSGPSSSQCQLATEHKHRHEDGLPGHYPQWGYMRSTLSSPRSYRFARQAVTAVRILRPYGARVACGRRVCTIQVNFSGERLFRSPPANHHTALTTGSSSQRVVYRGLRGMGVLSRSPIAPRWTHPRIESERHPNDD